MLHYFYLWDRADFLSVARPALSESWRRRDWKAIVRLYDHLATKKSVPANTLGCGLRNSPAFDRDLWRAVVGEILVLAAREVPRLPLDPSTLFALFGVNENAEREHFHTIQHALLGSRDLTFGGAFYRPLQAGWNDVDDVNRIACFLENVDPDQWCADCLFGLPGLDEKDARAEELADTIDNWPTLVEFYRRAVSEGAVVLLETP